MSLIFQISNKNNVARIPAKIETQKLYIEMLLNVCEYFLSNSKNITCYYKYDPQLFDILIIDDRMFIFFPMINMCLHIFLFISIKQV